MMYGMGLTGSKRMLSTHYKHLETRSIKSIASVVEMAVTTRAHLTRLHSLPLGMFMKLASILTMECLSHLEPVVIQRHNHHLIAVAAIGGPLRPTVPVQHSVDLVIDYRRVDKYQGARRRYEMGTLISERLSNPRI